MTPVYFQKNVFKEQQQRLWSYVTRDEERNFPLAFEGRIELRQEIKDRVTELESSNKPASCTYVVQGAPGAGKTSLLKQLELDLSGKKNVSIVKLSPAELTNTSTVLGKFLDGQPVNINRLRNAYNYKRDAQFGANTGFFKLVGGLNVQIPSLDQRVLTHPTEIWRILDSLLDATRRSTFVMLVDEAQRVADDKNMDCAATITAIHDGDTESVKIVPVFAGLSDASVALGSVGITRSARKDRVIRGLSKEEASSVVKKTLSTLRIGDVFSSEDNENIAQQLAYISDGWPRHLHQYQHALVAEIYRKQQNSDPCIDLDHVLEEGHENRVSYYDDRLKRSNQGYLEPQLSELAKEFSAEQMIEEEIILDKLEENPRLEQYSEKTKAVLDTFVHNGIFEVPQSGRYRFSIPSLHGFLSLDRDFERVKEALRMKVREFQLDSSGDSGPPAL